MIIGYDSIGAVVFKQNTPPISAYLLELKNAVYDEVHAQNIVDNNTSKKDWTNSTVLQSKFQDTLEAGNIQMRENPISKLRIKRRNTKKPNFVILKELPFSEDMDYLIYEDYTVNNYEEYEYIVTPVDSSNIEGIIASVSIKPEFQGWWLIDPDNPEENSFQFFYNVDDVTINTEEDRVEISTFAKYPIVRYGQKKARRSSLSGLFIPEGETAYDQYKKLDSIINEHKPLLLKDSKGRSFYVNVSAPTETILQKPNGLSRITVNWVEVEECND